MVSISIATPLSIVINVKAGKAGKGGSSIISEKVYQVASIKLISHSSDSLEISRGGGGMPLGIFKTIFIK